MKIAVKLTPNEYDAAAGYTETLTAVAVRLYPDQGRADIPWIDIGSAGIEWSADVDRWRRHDVPGWEEHDVDFVVYVVAEEDYRPLSELRVTAAEELDTFEFLATREDVARVREATAHQNQGKKGKQPESLSACQNRPIDALSYRPGVV